MTIQMYNFEGRRGGSMHCHAPLSPSLTMTEKDNASFQRPNQWYPFPIGNRI